MYDNVLREQLDNPIHYDRMIALIMLLNPACTDESWAISAINTCISRATKDGDCSTGMCAAYKTKWGKIRIFLEPIGDQTHFSKRGDDIRKAAFERSQEINRER